MIDEQLEFKIDGIPLGKETTQILINPCDQGHFGSSYCGNCHYPIPARNTLVDCPGCGYYFKGFRVASSTGGSDF